MREASADGLWPCCGWVYVCVRAGLIGETLEGPGGGQGVITGARVVDKSKNTRPEYRLELWTRTKDAATNQAIRGRLLQVGESTTKQASQQGAGRQAGRG